MTLIGGVFLIVLRGEAFLTEPLVGRGGLAAHVQRHDAPAPS
jgi:hypothetical protein